MDLCNIPSTIKQDEKRIIEKVKELIHNCSGKSNRNPLIPPLISVILEYLKIYIPKLYGQYSTDHYNWKNMSRKFYETLNNQAHGIVSHSLLASYYLDKEFESATRAEILNDREIVVFNNDKLKVLGVEDFKDIKDYISNSYNKHKDDKDVKTNSYIVSNKSVKNDKSDSSSEDDYEDKNYYYDNYDNTSSRLMCVVNNKYIIYVDNRVNKSCIYQFNLLESEYSKAATKPSEHSSRPDHDLVELGPVVSENCDLKFLRSTEHNPSEINLALTNKNNKQKTKIDKDKKLIKMVSENIKAICALEDESGFVILYAPNILEIWKCIDTMNDFNGTIRLDSIDGNSCYCKNDDSYKKGYSIEINFTLVKLYVSEKIYFRAHLVNLQSMEKGLIFMSGIDDYVGEKKYVTAITYNYLTDEVIHNTELYDRHIYSNGLISGALDDAIESNADVGLFYYNKHLDMFFHFVRCNADTKCPSYYYDYKKLYFYRRDNFEFVDSLTIDCNPILMKNITVLPAGGILLKNFTGVTLIL